MNQLVSTLLAFHVASGILVLAAAVVSFVSKWLDLPHRTHVVGGLAFVIGMSSIVITADEPWPVERTGYPEVCGPGVFTIVRRGIDLENSVGVGRVHVVVRRRVSGGERGPKRRREGLTRTPNVPRWCRGVGAVLSGSSELLGGYAAGRPLSADTRETPIRPESWYTPHGLGVHHAL